MMLLKKYMNSEFTPLYIIIGVLLIVFVGFEFQLYGDFSIYFAASQDLAKGINVYTYNYGTNQDLPYMASPALAYLLYPFSLLSLPVAAAIWKMANILLLYRLWILLEKHFSSVNWKGKQHRTWILLSILSLSFILYRNFHLSQFTVLLLYLIFEGIYQIRKSKYLLLGPFLLGLGITVKILPIVALPYLLFRGYWKQVLLSILFLALTLFLPALTLGFDFALVLNRAWITSISPTSDMNVFDVSQNVVHGIATLISTLTIDGIGNDYSLSLKRNIIDVNPSIVVGIIMAVKGLLLLSILFVLRLKTFFKDIGINIQSFYELSYILLISPLVFPQSRIYNFLFLLPAMSYFSYLIIKHREGLSMSVKVLLALSVLILNLELILGNFREYYWHFKSLTYATLVLLILLLWLKPEKFQLSNKDE